MSRKKIIYFLIGMAMILAGLMMFLFAFTSERYYLLVALIVFVVSGILGVIMKKKDDIILEKLD